MKRIKKSSFWTGDRYFVDVRVRMKAKDTVVHADGCSTNLGIIGATCNCGAEAQAEISFKAGIREAVKVYEPYINALVEENGGLIGLAYSHGWRSSQVEFGKRCRKKIKELKKILRSN